MAIEGYGYTPRSVFSLPEEWGRVQKISQKCYELCLFLDTGYTMRFGTGHKIDSWTVSVEFVVLRGDQIIAKCTDPEHAEAVLRMLLTELEDLWEVRHQESQERYKEEIARALRPAVNQQRQGANNVR